MDCVRARKFQRANSRSRAPHIDSGGGHAKWIQSERIPRRTGARVWTYHFLFRRISHGATRLQEVLADRVAASKYSPQAFEDGLTHIIRRQVEFEDVVYWEITNAQKAQRTVQNLYELKTSEEQGVEEKIKEAINRPTSEDDTHPSPTERFRLARRVTWNNELPLTRHGLGSLQK